MPFKSSQSGNPKGRARGSQNKITRALKESILQALYLRRLAIEMLASVACLAAWGSPAPLSMPAEWTNS